MRQIKDESRHEESYQFRLHRRPFPDATVIDGDASERFHGGSLRRSGAVAAALSFTQTGESILIVNTDVVYSLGEIRVFLSVSAKCSGGGERVMEEDE